MSGGVDDGRTCLHCALARVLRAEAPALAARGVTVTMGRSDPVWLPISGTRVYRGVRRVLRAAAAAGDHHVVSDESRLSFVESALEGAGIVYTLHRESSGEGDEEVVEVRVARSRIDAAREVLDSLNWDGDPQAADE
jgi:hypothetical protein